MRAAIHPPPSPRPPALKCWLTHSAAAAIIWRCHAHKSSNPMHVQLLKKHQRRRVSCVKDTKIENAATLTIQREDHTVGNVLRMCVSSMRPR